MRERGYASSIAFNLAIEDIKRNAPECEKYIPEPVKVRHSKRCKRNRSRVDFSLFFFEKEEMASIAVKVSRFLDCARGASTSTAELCDGVQRGRDVLRIRVQYVPPATPHSASRFG